MTDPMRDKKAEALAKEILNLARSSLLVNFRYLSRALSHLTFVSDEKISAATDGLCFYYNPWYVLSLYRSEPQAVTHDLLHAVLHCIFRHNLIGRDIDRVRWDLAADIAVESMIAELKTPALTIARMREQQGTLRLLQTELEAGETAPSSKTTAPTPLTAERIYRWLGEHDFGADELIAQRQPFIGDNHGLWYGQFDEEARPDEQVIRKIWEDVSKRMQTELETMQQDTSGALVQQLRQLNRAKHDYSEFLQRFGVHGEWMHLSEEEFDHNYYSYGLELYGDVLLVEPLEYSEQKRIREFVIAIDTSGSVRGDVVQAFIQHTHDMLCRRESFFERIEMHIIQCDDQIREDAVIRTPDEFQQYITNMEIKGLGQTDFRPVFAHVEELQRQGQLRHLQGLLYFTDGDGTFPGKKAAL